MFTHKDEQNWWFVSLWNAISPIREVFNWVNISSDGEIYDNLVQVFKNFNWFPFWIYKTISYPFLMNLKFQNKNIITKGKCKVFIIWLLFLEKLYMFFPLLRNLTSGKQAMKWFARMGDLSLKPILLDHESVLRCFRMEREILRCQEASTFSCHFVYVCLLKCALKFLRPSSMPSISSLLQYNWTQVKSTQPLMLFIYRFNTALLVNTSYFNVLFIFSQIFWNICLMKDRQGNDRGKLGRIKKKAYCLCQNHVPGNIFS